MGGDRIAQQIVRGTGEKLGMTLAMLLDILNPERIVLGGLAMRLANLLFDPALEVMRSEALLQNVAACQILPARLGEQIGDVSALCVAEGIARPMQATPASGVSRV